MSFPASSRTEAPARLLLSISRVLLLAVIVVAPWRFGGYFYQDQFYLACGLTAAGLTASLGLLLTRHTLWPLPTLTLVLAAAFGLGQSQIAGWDADVLSQQPTPPPPEILSPLDLFATHPVPSLYPASTRLESIRLLWALVALVLGATLFRHASEQRWLWLALAVNGAALSIFGIWQRLTWNGKLFWTVELTRGGQPFASYVNRNNAAGYITLCLTGAVGFAIWAFCRRKSLKEELQTELALMQGAGVQRRRRGRGRDYDYDYEHEHGREYWRGELKREGAVERVLAAPGRVLEFTALQWFALALVVASIAGVLGTYSRSGIAGMVLAVVVTTFFFQRLRKTGAATLIVLICAAGGALAMTRTGLSEELLERMATVFDERVTQDGRFDHWKDSIQAWRDHPWLGTGLGTYRYAYQPYEDQFKDLWFYNADNQYLEWLVEGGVAAMGVIVAGVVLFVFALRVLLTSPLLDRSDGVGYVGLFVLVASGFQALFDFGLIMTANMLCCAVICGAVAGRAGLVAVRQRWVRLVSLPAVKSRTLAVLLVMLVAGTAYVGLPELDHAGSAQTLLRGMPKPREFSQLKLIEIDSNIGALQRVLEQRPDDAELNREMGLMWVLRYRHLVYEEARERLAEQQVELGEKTLWTMTSLAVLHERVNTMYQQMDSGGVMRLKEDPIVTENLLTARRYYNAAYTACPALPRVEIPRAELAFLQEEDVSGQAYLNRAQALAPSDPDVRYLGGLLARNASLKERAWEWWRRGLELSEEYHDETMNAASQTYSPEQVVEGILPPRPSLILHIARDVFNVPRYGLHQYLAVQRAERLLDEKGAELPAAERYFSRAIQYQMQNKLELAIEEYRKAIAAAPVDTQLRYELCLAYRSEARYEEALKQARILRSLAPSNRRYEQLHEQLIKEQLRRVSPE